MANEEQLAILQQGVDVWNRWRKENTLTSIDLSGSDFQSFDLAHVNFGHYWKHSRLGDKKLLGYFLTKPLLYIPETDDFIDDVVHERFPRPNLSNCDFHGANLINANFEGAELQDTNFSRADLSQANLRQTQLMFTNFSSSSLVQTDFSESVLGFTIFFSTDIGCAIGLEKIRHEAPSIVEPSTLWHSQGKLSDDFLRGCGLSDFDIEYAKLADPDLSAQEVSEITHKIFELKDTRPIQISPLFISYSHADSEFVDKLESKLNEKGIRFWRDIHDATAGRLETQIDRAIRHNPTVLLILSEHSTSSDWVEHEARLARKLEKELGRDVLCPIALDDSWKTCNWPERIKEQIMEYNILDFSNWEDDAELDKMFKKLIDGLDMFYKK